MPDRLEQRRDGLPSLTGLRFWAALLVVGYHLSRQVGTLPVVSELTWYGRSGVAFFFVLSGFVLAWNYVDRMPSLRVFWWRRFARIWPLHVVATVLSVAVYLATVEGFRLAPVVPALFLVHAWSWDPEVVRGGNGATWSLSDEAFFYAVFPLLLALLAPRRLRVVRLVAVACVVLSALTWVVAALAAPDWVHRSWALDYLPLTRVVQFAAGVALGVAARRGRLPRVPLSAAVLAVLAWCAVLAAWHRVTPDTDAWGPYSASHALGTGVFALLVAAAARTDLAGRRSPFAGPWARRLGHWSFAWYLVHEVVVRVWLALAGTAYARSHVLLTWAVVGLASLALAGALYLGVEHPLERRLRRVVRDPVARRPEAGRVAGDAPRRRDAVDTAGGATTPTGG